jgi:diadenosine tetraphosphate (Ap4A) HIT family hydrolase
MATPCPFCDKLTHLDAVPGDELVWQFPRSVVLLGPWQYYQGYCVLVARTHATELHHLPDGERREYFDELCRLARAVEAAFRPRKLNYELLGNQVPHLHWHLFPRSATDPDHLKAVWLALDRADRDPVERHRLQNGPLGRSEVADRLRQELRR